MKRVIVKGAAVALLACVTAVLGGCPRSAEESKPAPAKQHGEAEASPAHDAPKPAPPVPYGAGGRWVLGPLVGAVVLNGQTGAKGDVVAPSGVVSTAAADGSSATLDLPYDVRVSLGPDTAVVRGEDASVLVLRGSVSVSAPPVGNASRKETRLVTAWGMVEVLGSGELGVDVLSSGDARLSVRSGRVAAKAWADKDKDATEVVADKPVILAERGLVTAGGKATPFTPTSRKRAAQAGAAALKDAVARFQSEAIRGRSLANAQREAIASHADAQVAARQKELVAHARALLALRGSLRLAYERAMWWSQHEAERVTDTVVTEAEQKEVKLLAASALSQLRRAPSAP